ncbi:ACT domain-containing protein [Kaistella jeonii]|uniref:Homoserine dehydrogenase n=1 Tax=Kaistella jeonii TaxID=266749 RepID=A0A0C1F9K5_9FLAO|nr:ACT domain-containing protein [Kaistella jeonii]KIA89817.1 homoserine dehydrogenase [Kaistella jeonii]SFB85663.1 homoserine dehydrogenase [Kaistella jeonii]VEI96053.1 Aspartokinase I/homoserine dehydrogenase I [Kaistella jeonii]
MKNRTEIKILKHKSIIKFEGTDFSGEVGIDGRIFKALTYARISVGVISQQAAENGISVLVNESDSEKAVNCLIDEFETKRKSGKVSQIYSINHVSVMGFIAKDSTKILSELARNNIFPLILNQVAAESKMNIVVTSSQDEKAKNIIEAEIFARPKTVHLAIIGHGKVGSTLIDQVLNNAVEIRNRKKLDLKIIAVANSRKMAFNKEGFNESWSDDILVAEEETNMNSLIEFSQRNQLENLIVIDNTASVDFVKNYTALAENGFDLVSSNKIFNTLPISEYRDFRHVLAKRNKKYLYETNVGAGLPLIDTIKLLHLSGENITRIKGVFSGSLSYIFNNFSVSEEKFSTILKEAMEKGFTEPDPREDLSGNDVARKLLILARELDLSNEFSDIKIENLIADDLSKLNKDQFLESLNLLDEHFEEVKRNQKEGYVLRFVGDLHGDLQQEKGELDVKLISVPANSALGQLKGSDSIFEIYTESYGENPLVIMGAGAGAKVTARGVFGDILRLSENK